MGELGETEIPGPNADWGLIVRFAHGFDGYEFAGGFEPLANLVAETILRYDEEGHIPEEMTLDQVRACLFHEARRYRQYGTDPAAEDLPYIHALVEAIRERIGRA